MKSIKLKDETKEKKKTIEDYNNIKADIKNLKKTKRQKRRLKQKKIIEQ